MAYKVKPAYLHIFFFLLGVFVSRLPGTIAQVTGSYDFFDPMIEIQHMLDKQYVEEPDWQKLQEGAINGMLEALDDPYAAYIPPSLHDDFEKAMTGEFVGIGAEVLKGQGPTIVDGEAHDGAYLEIASPLEDSPAFNAGIMAGDFITHIDGQSTLPLAIDECIALLTGKPGTNVTVTVQRNGQKLEPITLQRRAIVVKAVRGLLRDRSTGHYDYVIDPQRNIAYIRLTQFTPSAGAELSAAIKEAAGGAAAPGGLILDLRGNPGGMMNAALEIADLFLEEGTIMSERGRSGTDTVHRARKAGTLPDFPILVLVNSASASASEIVAGALQDHDRAVVLGTRTFGKGLVQTVQSVPSSGGGQVKFTAQRYYLPSGRLIQREDDSDTWGVDPNPGFYVPMSEDEQLERLTRRRELDIIRSEEQAAVNAARFTPTNLHDPEAIREQLADPQLAAALQAVQTRIDTGAWNAVGDDEAMYEALAADELMRLERARERMLREFTRLERRIGALADAADGRSDAQRDFDLWPDETELTDGTVQVRDKDGNVIAELKITGPDLERWLIDADVKPMNASATSSGADSTAPDAAATAPSPAGAEAN